MSRRSALTFLAVAGVLLAVTGVAGALVLGGGEDTRPLPEGVRPVAVDACRGLEDDAARACFADEFSALVAGQEDPRPAVERISATAWNEGGFLLGNCHVVMHTVGRTYAADAGVTLASLMDYLPQSNDPGCSAGFAHGLVTAVAGEIDPRDPRASAAACAEAGTRFQRYSCIHGFGHAFMRLYDDRLEPALELCTALGPATAQDCAQGAYHDYWFAVVGADGASLGSRRAETDPWRLCGAQPEEYVEPCWYRAFVENRPEGFVVETAEDVTSLCEGLEGVQREGCVTAASVIGPPDPALQLELCAGLADATDAAACVRGTKAQNLLDAPAAAHVRLIEGCAAFAAGARGACYRWLGKILAVLTDGRFLRAGCPALKSPKGRAECAAGARTMEDPLVTFS